MKNVERLALCGGTFDPFHLGHIEPIQRVRAEFGWDRIIFIPANSQPFKLGRETASPLDRFAMAALATRHDETLLLSKAELERGEVSYTVDSLEMVRAEYPEAVIDWIIGDDNLADLPAWKSVERVFELANFVVLQRNADSNVPPGYESKVVTAGLRGRAGAIVFAMNQTVEISSTEIRARLARNEAIDAFVDPAVKLYIQKHELYGFRG